MNPRFTLYQMRSIIVMIMGMRELGAGCVDMFVC